MFYLRYFNNTSEYQQEESSMANKRPSLGYTDDNEQFHWFPYVRTLSITAMSLSDFGTVSGGSGHWSQKMETEETTYVGELVIEGSNLDLISALTVGNTGCTVTTSVKSRKRNRKVYNVEITVTDTAQTNNCYVTFSYDGYDLSEEYDFQVIVQADNYLTFIPTEDGTFKFSGNSVNYSLDNGTTWTSLASNTDSPTVQAGNKIMWKATLTPTSSVGIGRFISTCRYSALGNPLSLIYDNDFKGKTSLSGNDYAFYELFYVETNLVNAENLALAATSLTACCYQRMFRGCTSLTTAPELPATTLANSAYTYMLAGCTSLTAAPELPATTLSNYCYSYMFYGCTNLTTAPELPATTLASSGYYFMFSGCTSLTTAPDLPATTLANGCYNSMFAGCTSLTAAPELPATTLASYCYAGMFSRCTKLKAMPQLPATTLASTCYSTMFLGCTSLTGTCELPAITAATSSYNQMFNGCTSLTAAPNISATTLSGYSCSNMFANCTALKTTQTNLLFSTLSGGSECRGMFSGCTSLVVAPQISSSTRARSSSFQEMFSMCTSLTTAPTYVGTPYSGLSHNGMFYGCTSLTSPPQLPSTSLKSNCYAGMFYGCTSLTTAPVLPAKTLVTDCYYQMFYGCSSLNYIKAMFTSTPSTSYTNSWVSGVASSGTYVKNSSASYTTRGINAIPSGWTLQKASS